MKLSQRVRRMLKLTQAQLAHLLGCSKQTVAGWEQESSYRRPGGTAVSVLTLLADHRVGRTNAKILATMRPPPIKNPPVEEDEEGAIWR